MHPQIAYYLNLAPDDGFYSTMASPFFAFVGFAITLAYLRGNVGSVVGVAAVLAAASL